VARVEAGLTSGQVILRDNATYPMTLIYPVPIPYEELLSSKEDVRVLPEPN